ncbi:uncharacterized protein I206_105497 [Kwoniella pini CBS 10737]|uniref:Nuclear transcription factor Y subunit beta n=1 Tax=Kwoniella pini CBS 10737 TaxID=1296096 RepID=A0A1B9I456_9TREE|nr:nuclear transcription factor Y subunit beta [Kwoniella pini CBS 10737]OCF50281.1 nuclear transcription factor Y subunit beta [Kwoniella pini CBS 10737]
MTDPTPSLSSHQLPNLAPIGNGPHDTVDVDAGPSNRPFTDAQVEEFREQDRWLPIANVARIMKTSLPTSAKVSKEAKECVQECVSEFISFITSEAAEKCLNEKRKTLNGEDILTSMRSLGFDNYEGVLRVYLSKYRDSHHNLPKRGGTNNGEDDEEDNSSIIGGGGVGEITTTTTTTKKKRGRGRQSNAVNAATNGNQIASGTIQTDGKGKKRKTQNQDDQNGVR